MYTRTKTKTGQLSSRRSSTKPRPRKARLPSKKLLERLSSNSIKRDAVNESPAADQTLINFERPEVPDSSQREKLLSLAVKSVEHSAPNTHFSSIYDDLGELPDSYGTEKLFLTARDPHWLHSYWDFTNHQMHEMRSWSCDHQIKLRVYRGEPGSGLLQEELTVHGESRNYNLHVGMPQNQFYAEIGFYDKNGTFQVRSRSLPAKTPAARVSDHGDVRFVTIPFRLSFRDLYELVKKYFRDADELLDVLYRLQIEGYSFPFDYDRAAHDIPDRQLLGQMFGTELLQRIRMGSEELSVWLQKRMIEQTSSGLFAPSSRMISAREDATNPFWFNVNAELIVYGMTERNANVVFDGKKIPLNPDGSFRFHFALPDGAYMTPITATSENEEHVREVHLHFQRNSRHKGEVGKAEQGTDLPMPPPGTATTFQIFETTNP